MECDPVQIVFGIAELRDMILNHPARRPHPIAIALRTAADTAREAGGPCDWDGPPGTEPIDYWAGCTFLSAQSDGSIYAADSFASFRCWILLSRRIPRAAQRGRKRRLRDGEAARDRNIQSFPNPYCGQDSTFWNWTPLPSGPPGTLAILQQLVVPDTSDLILAARHYERGFPVPDTSKVCGIDITVYYAKDKLLDIARDACPPDAQPDPSLHKADIVRHILAH